MKTFTDLKQSKKLAEFLPLESADMYYNQHSLENYYSPIPHIGNYSAIHNQMPCWSLTALMDVLDRGALFKTPKGWACQSYIEYEVITSGFYNNPIDACVEIILEIHKQKNK